jgi:hypothetical protein
MSFEKLLLGNNEVGVRDIGTDCYHRFQLSIPIHESLLKPDIKLDPRLANKVFPQAVAEWQKDIKTTHELPSGIKIEDLENYLQPYEITSKKFENDEEIYQFVKPWGFYDVVMTSKTGFARSLELNSCRPNVVHFKEDSLKASLFSRRGNTGIKGVELDFDQEKIDLYAVEPCSPGFLTCHHYGIHNPGSWVEVNLLRIWTINYLNAALTQLHEQGII